MLKELHKGDGKNEFNVFHTWFWWVVLNTVSATSDMPVLSLFWNMAIALNFAFVSIFLSSSNFALKLTCQTKNNNTQNITSFFEAYEYLSRTINLE